MRLLCDYMTMDEYKKKTQAMQERHNKEMEQLAVEYAHANNTFDVGDIVKDHIGRVKVRVIMVRGLYEPECVYRGVQYTVNSEPFKNGKERDVYQSNLLDT